MEFKERITAGLNGNYKGLSNGLNRVNTYIFGVQRSCYTLIGGLSGAAKTKYIDFTILNAIQDAEKQGIPINVFYYSFEIDEFSKRAEWTSILIYNKYKIIVSPEKIKGLGDFRLDAQELRLVEEFIPEVERLFNKIKWVWESVNPTGMMKEWYRFMQSRGKFIKEPYVDEHGQNKERIVKYVNNDPNEYNIVVIDHLALAKLERDYTLKENIDKLSEYTVMCRNLFGMTFFYLQQFNDGLSSVERAKFKGVDLSPQQTDFKDSRSPYIDSDIVLGLMNPYKMDMEVCLGYPIKKEFSPYNLKDRFRLLKIIKNRLSRDNISIGLLFTAEAGLFEELKPAKELQQADMDKIVKLVERK